MKPTRRTLARLVMTTAAAMTVLVGGMQTTANAEGELQAVAAVFYGQQLSSALISLPLEIPSPDLAKKCTVRFDVQAEYEKPDNSYYLYERAWARSTPSNCNDQSLTVNYVRVDIADEGSPGISSIHQTSEGGSTAGSTVNFVTASQTIPLYTFPTDQHMVGSRITFDFMVHLQFGINQPPVRVCSHAEAMFPGPISGGWVACRG